APAEPGGGQRQDVTLPSLGDGVTSADVLHVLVKVGDTVAKDQAVLELETDKATVEVPSPAAGTVVEVHVKDGDKVAPGGLMIVLEGGAGAGAAPAAKAAASPAPAQAATAVGKTAPAPDAKATQPPAAEARAAQVAAGAASGEIA